MFKSGRFGGTGRAASALVEALEQRCLLSGAATVQTMTDTDGDLVTVRVRNGGTVDPIDPVTRNIEVSGTSISSVLAINVQRSAGGDGLVQLGEIRCYGPMKAINGPQADISKEISINDLNLAVSPANKVSLNLGALRGVALYTGEQWISSFVIADWSMQAAGQELNAPSIDSFTVTGRQDVPGTAANEALPGNSGEIMILGDSTTTASTVSVGSISVAGTLGDIQATGRVGTITAGVINGQLQASTFGNITARRATGTILATGVAGVAPSIGSIAISGRVVSLSIATQRAGINSISVGGRMVNSSIQSTRAIGSLSVGGSLDASRVQTHNNIGSVTVGGMNDTDIQVGVASAFTGQVAALTDWANLNAAVGSFIVTGISGQPTATSWVAGVNTLASPRIGVMRLLNLDAASCLQIRLHDPASPAQVRYTSVASPADNFLWTPGNPLPAMLAAMLQRL